MDTHPKGFDTELELPTDVADREADGVTGPYLGYLRTGAEVML